MSTHHVPIVGPPPEPHEDRVTIVFDGKTGKRIGHSPHVNVEQVMHRTTGAGIKTTLKITPIKDDPCS